jgi:DNA-binding LacI/PurR family transcriptional regulator
MPAGLSEQTFAFLTGGLDDEYEVELLRGAIAGAREVGATLLCVAGGVVSDALFPDRVRRNFVFDLVRQSNVSGALVVASVLAGAVGVPGLQSWLKRFNGLPICCVGAPIPGYPCAQVDNPSGIQQTVFHLTREHGARRIAFVRGPRASPEAEIRLDAFERAIASEGLERDEKRIVDGDFSREGGTRAVATLFDERRLTPASLDAIVAANDYMALGALHEVQRRGMLVPDELRVTGFDDIESARLARPALTTVKQPTELLGRRAARTLADMVAGRHAEQNALLATELVIRTSCGCTPGILGIDLIAGAGAQLGAGASFIQRRQIILAGLARAASGRLGSAGSGWENRLLDGLVSEVRGGGQRALNRALGTILQRSTLGGNAELIQDVLTALRAQSLPCVSGDLAARDRLENAVHEARVFASLFGHEVTTSRGRTAVLRLTTLERSLRHAMFGGPDELSRVAASSLPELGVEACVVVDLVEPNNLSGGARVYFGFGPNGRLARREPVALELLTSHELVARSGRGLILLPVILRGRALGVALFSVVSVDGDLLEEAADLFGPALALRTSSP